MSIRTPALVLTGSIWLDPGERAQYLSDWANAIKRTRGEEGCIEYTLAPDPIEDDRIAICELWATREAFKAHLAGWVGPDCGIKPRRQTLIVHRIESSKPFGSS